MFLPLSATNDKIRLPIVTLTLIGINAFIFFFSSRLVGSGLDAFYNLFGLVPARVLSGDYRIWYKTFPFLTSMFVHGNLLHLAGNCLFLYVFGSELENRFGPRKYLYFYLLSGIYCGLFYVACEWQSTSRRDRSKRGDLRADGGSPPPLSDDRNTPSLHVSFPFLCPYCRGSRVYLYWVMVPHAACLWIIGSTDRRRILGTRRRVRGRPCPERARADTPVCPPAQSQEEELPRARKIEACASDAPA